ncbi:hypothetical protein P9Y39_33505 [Bacillus cereus]|nr:hypothetical protein [Bacillus cereus]
MQEVEIGKRKSKMLQVERVKESKAQKVCKLKEIGKRKGKLLQVEELRKERRKRNASK